MKTKKYKLSYCVSSIIWFIEMYLSIFIVFIPIFFLLCHITENKIEMVYFLYMLIIFLICTLIPIIMFLIPFLICQIFSKYYITLSNTTLTYKNFIIPLKDIKYINFVFPVISRTSSNPYGVCIKYYYESKEIDHHITINRIPLRVLFKIRNIIGKDKVIFEDIKKRYIKIPLILFGIGVLVSIIGELVYLFVK